MQSNTLTLFLKEFINELALNSISEEERRRIFKEVMDKRNRFNEIRSIINNEPRPEGYVSSSLMANRNNSPGMISFSKPSIENFQVSQVSSSPPGEVEVGLGRIERFTNDSNIVTIEVPGPGKFIVLKTSFGKQVITKTLLNKEEIGAILDYFSNESHIPRIGGIFKAIVGSLVITAIDSDVAGPRFIISKIVQRKSQFI